MTCREFAEFLHDYFVGDLTPARREIFEQHLAECANCVNYLATYRRTIELGKAAFSDEGASVPADVPEAIVRAVLRARATGPTPPSRRPGGV